MYRGLPPFSQSRKSSSSKIKMGKGDEVEEEKAAALHIYGDILEAILSRVPLIDLLPAYHVSKEWRQCAVRWSRAKPWLCWLIAHIQSSRNPSLVVTRAYDPESHLWIDVPGAKIPPVLLTSLPVVKSSHSTLVYTLSPSKLSFSLDPLNTNWHDVDAPKISRLDPVVAVVGSNIVIAGGTYDFEHDPLAVEIYNTKSRRWQVCQSMPDVLKGSAAATWLSVAVSDQKLFLLEKSSATVCTFDPNTKAWEGRSYDLSPPNESLFFSLIGFSNDRLFLVGLTGDSENVESLKIWVVNCETYDCTQVGTMPSTMLEKLKDTRLSSINISMASDVVYIYNSSDPKQIFVCQVTGECSCNWGCVRNSVVNDQNMMHRFVFRCSKISIVDLQKGFGVRCERDCV